jgi:diketogulonate reductase-like aldo/keto reductase
MTRNEFIRLIVGATATYAAGPALRAAASKPSMHTRIIPSSNEPLPVVGCGTWRTFDVGGDQKGRAELREVLAVLFDNGGSMIDSSPMYGTAEAVAGDLLTTMQARDRAFIATKVWTQGRNAGMEQMRRSMAFWHTERIDLMQIHNLVDWRTHLATLRAWKKDGAIRYLGITHYTTSAYGDLEAVMRAEPVDFVQINYALDDRTAEQRLLSLAADRGIAVIVNQPFGGGGLLRSMLAKPLPAWANDIGCTTWAQVLLKFVLANPAVTCVIPGTGKAAHMRDNVRAGVGSYPDAALRERMIALVS